MSKFLNFKIALPVAILISGSGSAYATLNCTEQPTCAELGYTKDDVDNCEHYLYCPFDTNYKLCTDKGCKKGYAQTINGCNTTGRSGGLANSGGTTILPGGSVVGGGITVGGVSTVFHPEGWTLDLAEPDGNGCYKCTPKDCPEGYTAESSGTMTACFTGQIKVYNGYSGNNRCSKCQTCPTDYATSANNCGTGIGKSAGWKVDTSDVAEGYTGCYKCVKKDCPSGATTSPFCTAPASAQETGNYSGDGKCYKCIVEQCTDGYARSADDCYSTGSDGWELNEEEQDAFGCYKCKARQCPFGTNITPLCVIGTPEETDSYSGDKVCYKCVNHCSEEGYRENKNMMCSGYSVLVESKKEPGCYKCETCYFQDRCSCSNGNAVQTLTKPNGETVDCIYCTSTVTEGTLVGTPEIPKCY